jgi:hypothetical protein
MTGAFYLMTPPNSCGEWYMLMVRKTHFCISCGGDLQRRLEVLKSTVKDYRTEQRLLDALERLDCGGRVSPATFEQREEYFQEHSEDYEDLVKSIVLEALAEAREEDKANSPLRKAKARLQKAGGAKTSTKTQEVKPIEVRAAQQVPPTILRKPRVFNRK